LLFLGQDVFDVGFEEGEGVEDLGADGALRAGFDFGLCARGDAGVLLGWGCRRGLEVDVLFLEHCGGCVCGGREALLLLLKVGDAVAPQCACVWWRGSAERNIDSTWSLVFHLCSTAITMARL
jgi:hypothetical protein